MNIEKAIKCFERQCASGICTEADKTALTALREKQEREKGCAGCTIYAGLQRYHRSQQQCSDCKNCIRIARDRYQEAQK